MPECERGGNSRPGKFAFIKLKGRYWQRGGGIKACVRVRRSRILPRSLSRGAISESGPNFAPVWTRQVRIPGPDSSRYAGEIRAVRMMRDVD